MRRAASLILIAVLALAGPSARVALAQVQTVNGAQSTLASGIASGATTLTVTTGEGARFPATSGGQFWLMIWNQTDYPAGFNDPTYEVVLVTSHTAASDTFTITRAQQGTADSNHNSVGKTYAVSASWTASDFNAVTSALTTFGTPQAISTTSTPSFAGLTINSALSWDATDKAFELTADTSDAGFDVTVFEASGAAGKFDSYKGRGTAAAPRRAQSGDTIWTFRGFGAEAVDDSTTAAFPSSASLQLIGKTREAHTASAHGTELWFATTPTGSTTLGLDAIMNTTGLTMSSNRGVYSNLFSGLTKGKIVFEPTFGADGVLNFYPSSEARPLAQLEDAVASGGTARTDVRFTLWGRSGAGAVSNFFSAQMNLGAIDGTSASAAYGLITDGTWTNGGGFGSNTQFLLHDEINVRNILRQKQSTPLLLEVFDGVTGGELATRGLTVSEDFTLSGDNAPAQIAAATNDYAISATASVVVVDADQIRALTGMTGGTDGRQVTLINDGASDSIIILRQEDTGSTAANRFAMAADVVLEPNRSATFWYDSTASRWRMISNTATAGAMRDYLPFDYNELIGTATADTKEATEPWNYAVIASGTQTKVAGDATHRGILRTTSSTTTNSGGVLNTDITAYRLSGGEFAEFIFNVDTLTTTTIRMGFLDTAASTDAVDGAYIEIPSTGAATCKTANNSTRTTSSTVATLSTATWYRARIEVDNTAANVTCTIFDANGNSLGSQTNSANIPTGSGRETGHGYVATNSGTTAVNLIQMDYLAVGTKRAVIR